MKSQLVILVLVSLVAFAHCFPDGKRDNEKAGRPNFDNSNVDTVLILPGLDTGFGRPTFGFDNDDSDADDDRPFNPFNFSPIHNPFGGFFDSLQSTMKRLREQMMSRLPTVGTLYPFNKIPEGANTTSTTKVIDGHIVTINETTFNDDNPNSTFVFKIRTVDVKPENATDTQVTTGVDGDDADNNGGEQIEDGKETKPPHRINDNTTERSIETVEDPGNNEIPDNQVDTLKA